MKQKEIALLAVAWICLGAIFIILLSPRTAGILFLIAILGLSMGLAQWLLEKFFSWAMNHEQETRPGRLK